MGMINIETSFCYSFNVYVVLCSKLFISFIVACFSIVFSQRAFFALSVSMLSIIMSLLAKFFFPSEERYI